LSTFPYLYLLDKERVLKKNRFQFDFTGSALDTGIWIQNDVTSTGTFAMSDNLNGGFSITTNSVNGSEQSITFNSRRQFNFKDAVIIGVIQTIASASRNVHFGFNNQNTLTPTSTVTILNNTAQSFYRIRVHDGTSQTNVNMTTVPDELVHVLKIHIQSTQTLAFIDGTLEATNTREPLLKMQPFFYIQNLSGGTARETRIIYLEAFNT